MIVFALGATFFSSVAPKIPAVVNQVAMGVEEIVEEVVVGSKAVVHAITHLVMLLAIVTVVQTVAYSMAWAKAYQPWKKVAKKDAHNSQYGGRLRGGGKQGFRSVRDLFGHKPEPAEEGVGVLEELDWNRISEGQYLEFEYYRGARSGQRRRVLIKKIICDEDTGSKKIQCQEMNGESRTYWPAYMGKVAYCIGTTDPVTREVRCDTSASQSSQDRRRTVERALGDLDQWKQGVGLVRRASPPQQRQGTAIDRARASASSGSPVEERQLTPVQDLSQQFEECEESREPEVEFFSGKEMLPMVLKEIDGIKESFQGMQYVIDHEECCLGLVHKAGEGVRGQLLLDRDNFYDSSCVRQALRIYALWHEGVEIRLVKPKGVSGFACMHVKSWVFDDKVLISGSCNLTHGGLENNIEHMYKINAVDVIGKVKQNFSALWETGTQVNQDEIDLMMKKRDQRIDRKRSSSMQRSSSAPRTHRSSSRELRSISEG